MSRETVAGSEASPFHLDAPTPGRARLLTCPTLQRPGILHGFSTRTGLDAQGQVCAMDFGLAGPAGPSGDGRLVSRALPAFRPRRAGTAPPADPQGRGHREPLEPEAVDKNAHGARHLSDEKLAPEQGSSGSEGSEASRRLAWQSLHRRLKTDPAHLFTVRQVHGALALEVGPQTCPGDLGESEADALITAVPGTAVAVRTADCVPVLLADPERGVVAAVHAGWRGTVGGIIEQTIRQMGATHGCQPRDMVAAVGPAIGARAFETGRDVAAQFAHLAGVVVGAAAGQRPHVDLKLAACSLLQRCGVGQIATSDLCTFDRAELFHSYRRDGANAGRQLSVIGLHG